MSKFIVCLLSVLLPFGAIAADPKAAVVPGSAEYSMFKRVVKFSAPADWPVIMQKTEGVPLQFFAFRIKDTADQDSDAAGNIQVEAKLLNDASTFQALVNAATDKAKMMPGYEQHADGVDATTLRYFALRGKQRFEYRETWYLNTKILVHVRCSRPILAATAPTWIAAYEAGCAQIMQTAKPR